MASAPSATDRPLAITLSEVDWEKFVEALENPPEPTEGLKKLFTKNGPMGDNKPFTLEE